MKKIISVLMAIVLLAGTFSLAASAKEKTDTVLKFGKDGKFRIMYFCDIQDGMVLKTATKEFLKLSVEAVEPDLIVLGGDNISGGSCATKTGAKIGISNFMKIFEKTGVPVAIVFGNHDDQGKASKEDMMAIYESYDCFAGCEGPALTGCGNYNLPILSSDGKKTAFNLWMFDSLSYNDDDEDNCELYKENDLGGYGCVHKDQIEWYKKTSDELKKANNGKTVPSFAFQHIVVPEIWDALTECDKDTEGCIRHGDKYYTLPAGAKGKLGESPCPPQYTNGQFDAMKSKGDVLAMFFAHDHTNTYEVMYKGINLINTPGAGFRSYGDNDRGCRVIEINEKDPSNYDTYVLRWRDLFEADDNEMYNALFVMSGSEFEFGDQFTAFFTYIFRKMFSAFIK